MYNFVMTIDTEEPEINLEALKWAIDRRDWSDTELSAASGVSKSMISLLRKGKRPNTSAAMVAKLARSLGVSTDYLMGRTDDPSPINAPPLPDYAVQVVEEMRKLDRARNYELLLLAQTFVREHETIRRMSEEDFLRTFLNLGDEVKGEEATNRMMEAFRALERRLASSDSSSDGTDQPS